MASDEYYDGIVMESNHILHKFLIEKMELDSISSSNSIKKSDIVGLKGNEQIGFSLKSVSSRNTQVHLTTLNKLSKDLQIDPDTFYKLEKWLGTNNEEIFNSWIGNREANSFELRYRRILSSNIEGWVDVEQWMNINTKNGIIPKLLLKSLENNSLCQILIWFNKKNRKIQLINIEKLIQFIKDECTWITIPRGTVLRCITPNNKPILWLQMKGNRTEFGYNHCPQFHICHNWPDSVLLYNSYMVV